MQQRFSETLNRVLVALLMLVVVSLPSLVQAKSACPAGSVVLDSTTSSVRNLDGCIWYLEDGGHELVIDDILAMPKEQFSLHRGGVLNFGYTDSAYWTRFDLTTRGSQVASNWILELALPLVDEVWLYVVRDGRVVEQRRAGYLDNWDDRDLAVPNPTFRLQLVPDATTTVYLRTTTTNTFRLPVTLWHPDSYIEKVSIDEAVRGVLLGAILAILAYNLFVAVSVRERSNIYYVLYLICAAVFIATEQVHGVQLLDNRPPILDKAYLHFQIILTWFFGLLMAALLYLPGMIPTDNQTVDSYWRWWVVHLWVEGFFEVFATVVIAFLFTRMGLLKTRTATAAVLFATQLQVIQSTTPVGLELVIITASVVGGVSILGGVGTVFGSTLAAILFAAIGSSLIFLNVSAYWLRAVQGILILATVLADMARRRRTG